MVREKVDTTWFYAPTVLRLRLRLLGKALMFAAAAVRP